MHNPLYELYSFQPIPLKMEYSIVDPVKSEPVKFELPKSDPANSDPLKSAFTNKDSLKVHPKK